MMKKSELGIRSAQHFYKDRPHKIKRIILIVFTYTMKVTYKVTYHIRV